MPYRYYVNWLSEYFTIPDRSYLRVHSCWHQKDYGISTCMKIYNFWPWIYVNEIHAKRLDQRKHWQTRITLPERGCVEVRLNSCSVTPFAPLSSFSKFCQKNIFPFRLAAAVRQISCNLLPVLPENYSLILCIQIKMTSLYHALCALCFHPFAVSFPMNNQTTENLRRHAVIFQQRR